MDALLQRTARSLARAASFAKEAALETLWPTRCAICDAPGQLICADCRRQLAFVDVNRACPVCGAPYGQRQCTECNDAMLAAAGRDVLPVDGMASALLADEAAQRIVRIFKDANEQRLVREMARMMARCIPPEWRDARLACIPATREAVRRRGFDHAELMLRALADETGMGTAHPFAPPESADQRQLDRRGRQRNMQGRIQLTGSPVPVKVLLADDVCTTGATLFAAAERLRDGGAKEVYAITFAKVLAS